MITTVAKYNISSEIFAKRLKELMGDNNETTYSIAEYTNLTAATISRYASGKMSPKITTIETLARHFNVNPAWLMGYDVKKELIKKESIKLSKGESKILSYYNKLNDLGKKEAEKRVEELAQINKYIDCSVIVAEPGEEYNVEAAHDDNLTQDEKSEMDKRIAEFEKNR